MKIKLFLLLILAFGTSFNSSAFKMLMGSGMGGGYRGYSYIVITESSCNCTGSGSLTCPVRFGYGGGMNRTTWHSFGDVIDYVFEQIKSGNKSGNTIYKDDLPVSWKLLEDQNVSIDIKETGVKGLEKYYAK